MKCRPATARRKQTQGGFILLIIFMMAGAIALMMYAQLPRVAFESEREKEQVLIDRGEQFIRAIQLYQLDNAGQWPQSLDDLEKHNNKRYLRRRYLDPYTGKSEWRLIHTNGAQLTDSLVTKAPTVGSTPSTSTTQTQPQEQQVNAAVLARPSDVTLPGAQNFSGPAPPNNVPQFPNNLGVVGQGQQGFGVPGGLPGGVQLPGNVQTNGQPQFPGQQFPGQQFPGQPVGPGGQQPQFPGQQFPGQQPSSGVQPTPGGFQPQFPGQQFPGQQTAGQQSGTGVQTNVPPGFQLGPNGQLVPLPIGGAAPLPGAFPGANPSTTPGVPGGAANAGLDVINRLLTTPRAPPAGVAAPQNNAVGGGGIAGVASTHTGPSIKVYKERSKYEEWEFVFTRPAGAAGAGGAAGAAGAGGRGGTPTGPGGATGPGTTGFGTGSGFGGGAGTGRAGAAGSGIGPTVNPAGGAGLGR